MMRNLSTTLGIAVGALVLAFAGPATASAAPAVSSTADTADTASTDGTMAVAVSTWCDATTTLYTDSTAYYTYQTPYGSAVGVGLKCSLYRGTSGPGVMALQKILNCNGAPIAVDGKFGPGTEAALMSAQRRAGVDDDGRFGPRTREALAYPITRRGSTTVVKCARL